MSLQSVETPRGMTGAVPRNPSYSCWLIYTSEIYTCTKRRTGNPPIEEILRPQELQGGLQGLVRRSPPVSLAESAGNADAAKAITFLDKQSLALFSSFAGFYRTF
jgi:hypothetical protein